MSSEKSTIEIALLAILACFLWSTAFAGIKIGLHYTTPLNFAGIRFMIAGALIFPFCGGKKWFSEVFQNVGVVLKIGFLQTFLLYTFFYIGVSKVPGAIAAIVTGFSPLWAALFAHFFMQNDKLTPKKIISFLIGIAGVSIIAFFTKPTNANTSQMVQLVGVLSLVIASLSSGFANVVVAKDKKKVSPLILNSAQLFFGGLMMFLLSLPLEGVQPIPTEPKYYYSLGYLSFLSAAAFSIWFTLLKQPNIKISFLNIWKFLLPVSGAIVSWIILPNESPSLIALVGMTLVGLSIVVYNWRVE